MPQVFSYSSPSKVDLEHVSIRGSQRVHRSSTDGSPPSPSPAEHHYAGPSRINWLPCEPGASSRSLHAPQRRLSMHAHPLGRSASSPTLPLWPVAPRIYSHPSMSSHHSLQLDRLYAERPVESEDSLALLHLQPLSPIIEQTQLGGSRRTRKTSSVNESPLTPETLASLDHGDHGSTYSAFLKRPLKRSVSQASSSSMRTVVTTTAPTLPPLDLRPPFVATHRTGPQLFSTVYEDAGSERTGSFVTARSIAGSDHDPDPHLDPGPERDLEAQIDNLDVTFVEPPSNDADATFVDTVPSSSPSPDRQLDPSRPRSPPSVSSSFLSRRWRKGLSFGSTRPSFTSLLPSKEDLPPLPALLFWVGFVAPWCWLIGGWLVGEGRGVDTEGKGPIIPFWVVHKADDIIKPDAGGSEKGKTKETVIPKQAEETSRLTTQAGIGAHQTVDSTGPPRRSLWRRLGCVLATDRLDPGDEKMVVRTKHGEEVWVVRCRLAAAVSGMLLVVAFVVALIVVGRGS